MNTELTDSMVADMDETADWMHQPAQTSVFNWRGTPSTVGAQLRPHRIDRSTESRRYCYPVEGQAAGEKSFHRRQAIRLGGI
ncbi:hypothetical protein QFZ42_003338 [Variovorax paradoxus]|uniref:hypothetical protein n=1 Tax=Variovorax paradoxus TaxID=34073 RepID=UPI00278EDE20|nr:hypothetical protein [Variovorax paradoxus]MDQ0571504.1 hypothetical protein [Variovorax paradoxus]